jgi:hypothetical protein
MMTTFRFNDYAGPRPTKTQNEKYLYSSDPAVELKLEVNANPELVDAQNNPVPINPRLRSKAQLGKLAGITASESIFGPALDWAFYGCIVHQLSIPADLTKQQALQRQPEVNLPIDEEPQIPKDEKERRDQLTNVFEERRRLGLFNIIVACEWRPNQAFIRQLKWAFKRASDFLYDVTNGYMAIGQVVIGGPERMNCADIQIMASNRLFPRSWVDGLFDTENKGKYMPIRVGRGLWHKNNRIAVPWDEPEAYRTLVHEWAHYALALKDRYLELPKVVLADPRGKRLMAIDQNIKDRGTQTVTTPSPAEQTIVPHLGTTGSKVYHITTPSISLAVESIMATLEGTSELVPSDGTGNQDLATIAAKFPFLHMDLTNVPDDGPGRVPLPLPYVHLLPEVEVQDDLQTISLRFPKSKVLNGTSVFELPASDRKNNYIQTEHCWVYVIKGDISNPTRLIAQGSLDARTEKLGFTLLGAEVNDTVILIGYKDSLKFEPLVVQGKLTNTSGSAEVSRWVPVTPKLFPMIDVLPVNIHSNGGPISDIRVEYSSEATWVSKVFVFPLGETTFTAPSRDGSYTVSSLDGYVFLTDEGGTQLIIATYSQGGSPSSAFPGHPNPIAAGSSDGNTLLFFHDDAEQDFSDVRVVTTMNYGIDISPANLEPRSYTFSVASNKPLPDLRRTLVMFYDKATAKDYDKLMICRYDQTTKTWQEIETYLPPGAIYAAAPLVQGTADGIIPGGTQSAEHYRMCFVNT